MHRHVQDQFFGAQVDNQGNIIPLDEQALIRNMFAKIPKLCSTDARLMSTMHYDSYYGIHDHLRWEEQRPLGMMGFHPAEDVHSTHPLVDVARDHANLRINDFWGISLDRWVMLPHSWIEILSGVANDLNQEAIDIAKNAENEANRTQSPPKKVAQKVTLT